MDLEELHALHAYEMCAPSPLDTAWERYCTLVERAMDIADLDGDEDVEGYSIDSAYAAFIRDIPPASYAAGIRADNWR